MPTCKYCDNYESSKWNLAGYVCSECRLSCPECGKDNKMLANRYVVVDEQAYRWCNGCGQLLPPEVEDLEAPIDDKEVTDLLDYYGVRGLTWRDGEVFVLAGEAGSTHSADGDMATTFLRREIEESPELSHVSL